MRAQFSLETLFIIGISFAFLIPVMLFFYQFMTSSSDKIIENQVSRIGQQYIDYTNLVYNYGDKTLIQVEMTIPERIINMTVENNNTVVILVQTVRGKNYYNFPLGINVTGQFTEMDWSPGHKTYEFYCRGEDVSWQRV